MSWLDAARNLFGSPAGDQEQGSWWRSISEPLATMATGAVAAPVAGIAGLADLATGGSPASAAERVGSVSEALTYRPRTVRGNAGLAAAGRVIGPVGEVLAAPGKALGSAGFPLAGAALTAGAETFTPGPKGLKMPTREVFHGTPHDFPPAVIVQNDKGEKRVIDAAHLDKLKNLGDERWAKVADLPMGGFQSQRIGTGEGAQVYGSGHYFSTHPEIAKHYQKVLSRGEGKIASAGAPNAYLDANSMFGRPSGRGGPDAVERAARSRAFSALRDAGLDKTAALSKLASSRDWYRSIQSENVAFDRAVELVKNVDTSAYVYTAPNPGRFIKAEIPHESKMLDWDKPFVDQPTDVRIGLEKVGILPIHPNKVREIADRRLAAKYEAEAAYRAVNEYVDKHDIDLLHGIGVTDQHRAALKAIDERQTAADEAYAKLDREYQEAKRNQGGTRAEIEAARAEMQKAHSAAMSASEKLDAFDNLQQGVDLESNQKLAAQRKGLVDAYRSAATESQNKRHDYELLNQEGFANMTGRQLYKKLVGTYGSPEEASAALNNAGIPGISYIGGTSDERNMVVFDDTLINILEKGSVDPKLLALLAGGAGLGVTAAQNDEKP